MKVRSLALVLSLLLCIGSLCGCDPVTEITDDSSTEPTSSTIAADDTTVTTTTTMQETTTTKKFTTSKKATTSKMTEAKQDDDSRIMVWIPTKGGTKYHSKSSCSKMIDPEHVTLEEAKLRGFTACGRCYK